ncbi:hypothetical protein AAIH25_15150 [Arthrobacter crystallopoietes]|uniref:hypothetical protein n=1 Tax=Crystallibacter crystallopoietes TaxID=37928 RepID=UPI003D1C88EC
MAETPKAKMGKHEGEALRQKLVPALIGAGALSGTKGVCEMPAHVDVFQLGVS